MSLPLIVLILVFLGIALRQLFRIPLKIWHIMGVGACIVLFTGKISLLSAWAAIDWSIIFFLFGMFVIGQAIEESGYLSECVARFLGHNCSHKKLVAMIVFGMGLFSAVLMNDTIAIVGTPVLLKVAHHRGIKSHPLLMGLAFAITIGSIMSPIGNPQNLFIALEVPIESPFVTFLRYLAFPTLINLAIVYFFILYLIRREVAVVKDPKETLLYNRRLMTFCIIAMAMVLIMAFYNIVASFLPIFSIPLPWIALIPAFFLLIFAPKRKEVITRMDWHTLIFFVAMFILMRSVWEASVLKDLMMHTSTTIEGIMMISTAVSQLISNVPLVALYLPILKVEAQPILSYMALAVGSSIAGNLLIFGAASNLIITQNAEKRGDKGISFFEFALYGIPLTIVNLLVYWVFLTHLMHS
jgi:Na+/H+ antiporter NhaD/arsenite permease-like protein